ncbi:MAG: nicotinate (nicotinamide) nucleotide adenylyltransferase [Elusimicrobia bacterium]|nr:nicotinate (nicotinamide) nucleotide adenylyltransferase [Elusimicrobiota bacterium]
MTDPIRPGRRPAYGFFGGSFDPVQAGHIALARAALKERGLKRVYLVPAGCSPFKEEGPRASGRDRIRLIRAAIRGVPGLCVAKWELGRAGPSFTYQTLRSLHRRFPHRRWELVMGQDAWASFTRWRRWRELAKRCPLVVGRRPGTAGRGGPSAFFLRSKLPLVSSTRVREALAQGKSVRRWVPSAVALEMKRRGLYPRLPTGLSARRTRHSAAVAHWAMELARRYGADPARAERAGLYHDLAKEWRPDRLSAYAKINRLRVPGVSDVMVSKNPSLLHGVVSAHVARQRGWVKDRQTFNAMARHTTGHGRMGRLDKIIFVADYSSPDRPWAESVRVRRAALKNLERAFRLTVYYKSEEVLQRGGTLPRHSVRLLKRWGMN